jgi:tRNA U34 5-carboxymethylaminomethyl modifying enzyme MnmG/GidA
VNLMMTKYLIIGSIVAGALTVGSPSALALRAVGAKNTSNIVKAAHRGSMHCSRHRRGIGAAHWWREMDRQCRGGKVSTSC